MRRRRGGRVTLVYGVTGRRKWVLVNGVFWADENWKERD